MEYIKKECKTFNLHMIKTKKFKATTIELIFGRDIKKEEITITNFLSSILTYTTKKYSTKIEFSHNMENLYAARVFANSYRLGKQYNVDFNMRILNDKYAEKGLLENSLDFLKEIIFNPNVSNNKFDETSFNVIKNDEKSQIERFREDARRYSALRILEITNDKAPFSYNLKGYMDDLEKIKRENLYDFYKEFVKCNNIDLFIIGDIDFKETERIVKEKFKFEEEKAPNVFPIINLEKRKNKISEVIEPDKTNQAKLSISCRLEDLTTYERNYVLVLYNSILGGTPDSKFFKNIREKHSLCYYVTSGANKLDNLLLISSGITKDNYKKIITLIKKEMNDMKKGMFSQEDIDKAKRYYLSGLQEIEDSPNQIIASYYAIDKLGIDCIEKRKKTIQNVTKEDIILLANKIFIDSVYLLGGDKK